ncbi:MAG: TatD family hydrolase [Eubacteriales bacterium]
MFFDSHAHMCDRRFDGDRDKVMSTMQGAEISLIMEIGCDLQSSKNAIALAEQYPFVYAAVGSHPDDADHLTDETLDAYRVMSTHPKVKALGEFGLDYHYEDVPRALQQETFRRQMALAAELDMPVIIHSREAAQDSMDILAEFPTVKGVFHCYGGSLEMAKELVKQGWYVGFTGVLTFSNAKKALEVAKNLPHDRVLIETDCPYMAPVPHRGKRNDSRLVRHVCEKLAELWGLSVEETAKITMDNAKRLYRI